jgi:hypothetical protein
MVAVAWIVVVMLFTAAVLFAVFGAGWRMFHPHHRH